MDVFVDGQQVADKSKKTKKCRIDVQSKSVENAFPKVNRTARHFRLFDGFGLGLELWHSRQARSCTDEDNSDSDAVDESPQPPIEDKVRVRVRVVRVRVRV